MAEPTGPNADANTTAVAMRGWAKMVLQDRRAAMMRSWMPWILRRIRRAAGRGFMNVDVRCHPILREPVTDGLNHLGFVVGPCVGIRLGDYGSSSVEYPNWITVSWGIEP